MKIKISNHTIEYSWDDGLRRELGQASMDTICDALVRKKTKGRLYQNEDGALRRCDWEDITDDDIMKFGLTQGWFR